MGIPFDPQIIPLEEFIKENNWTSIWRLYGNALQLQLWQWTCETNKGMLIWLQLIMFSGKKDVVIDSKDQYTLHKLNSNSEPGCISHISLFLVLFFVFSVLGIEPRASCMLTRALPWSYTSSPFFFFCYLFVCLLWGAVLMIKRRVLGILGKCSTTESHPQLYIRGTRRLHRFTTCDQLLYLSQWWDYEWCLFSVFFPSFLFSPFFLPSSLFLLVYIF
jgi:hypothetical protein